MIHDTLKLTKALEPTFSREQAEALTTALSASTQDTVALKSDLVEMKFKWIKWTVGAIVLNLFGTAGLVLALVKFVAHQRHDATAG